MVTSSGFLIARKLMRARQSGMSKGVRTAISHWHYEKMHFVTAVADLLSKPVLVSIEDHIVPFDYLGFGQCPTTGRDLRFSLVFYRGFREWLRRVSGRVTIEIVLESHGPCSSLLNDRSSEPNT